VTGRDASARPPFLLLAFHASIQPVSAPRRAELKGRFWHPGCPVPLSQLRILTVTHWGFDRRAHTGRLVVNEDAAAPLARVFRRVYELRFPIRHMRLADAYGPSRHAGGRPGLPLDRLGLRRRLGWVDQGLHALLRHRPLGCG
jgi:hypothetical protein